MLLPFTKMHGLGNDYIYFDLVSYPISSIDWQALSVRLSNRHTGIGGDGIVLIMPPTDEACDFRMRIFNADSSEAEMCGNASRCIGKYVYERGLTSKTDITLETGAGVKTLHLQVRDGVVESVCVEMGKAVMVEQGTRNQEQRLNSSKDEGLRIKDKRLNSSDYEYSKTKVISPSSCVLYPSSKENPSSFILPPLSIVDMGNPHAVVMVEGAITDEMVWQMGPRIEKDRRFPHGTNVEFVRVENRQELTMRVWERGSGETMACGTGACASAVVAYAQGLTDNEVTVHLLGGDLQISIDHDWNVQMTGGATIVFDGEVES
ncbi:MAG: diaminopimelate epimerase [Paludibacteraceae bacterium]